VVSPAFKLFKGLTGTSTIFPVRAHSMSPSSTSGGPQLYLYELRLAGQDRDRYRLTFASRECPKPGFCPFAPASSGALSKKPSFPDTEKKGILRMQLALEAGTGTYDQVDVTVTSTSSIPSSGRAVRRPASLRKASAADVASILHEAERSGSPSRSAGSSFFSNPTWPSSREGEFHLGANGYIAVQAAAVQRGQGIHPRR